MNRRYPPRTPGEQEPGLFVILRLCRALDVQPGELLAAFTPTALKRLRLK